MEKLFAILIIGIVVGFASGWHLSLRLPLRFRPHLRRKIRLSPELKRKLWARWR